MSENNKNAEKESLGILKNIGWVFSNIWSIISLIAWTGFLALVAVFERFKQVENVRRVDKKQFWENVIKCLMKFHDKSFDEAMQLVSTLRQSKNKTIYLQEPFRVANELALVEVKLTPTEYKKQYLEEVLGQH